MRALVPPALVCTTLRTERPARPVASVPGSPATGAVAQAPTQVPVEAGAACESRCGRPAARVLRGVPSSAATVTYMPADTAMTSATSALRTA